MDAVSDEICEAVHNAYDARYCHAMMKVQNFKCNHDNNDLDEKPLFGFSD